MVGCDGDRVDIPIEPAMRVRVGNRENAGSVSNGLRATDPAGMMHAIASGANDRSDFAREEN